MNIILLAIVVLLILADAATTIYGVKSGKASEGNGLLKGVIDAIGLVPAILLTRIPSFAILYFLKPPAWSLGVVAAVYAAIVWNNVRILRK